MNDDEIDVRRRSNRRSKTRPAVGRKVGVQAERKSLGLACASALRRPATRNASTASAALAPTTPTQLLARGAADAGEAAERGAAAPCAGAGRCRAHRRAPTADRASTAPCGGTSPRTGAPRRGSAAAAAAPDRLSASAIGSSRSRVKSSSSFFAMPTATRFARPSCLERLVGGRELPLAAVDHDQIGKRPAVLEHACDSGAGRPRASPRSRRGIGARLGCGLGLGVSRRRQPDPELPVLALLHPAVFAHHHRRDGLAALDRRDVEALDAARQRRQAQHRRAASRARRIAPPCSR